MKVSYRKLPECFAWNELKSKPEKAMGMDWVETELQLCWQGYNDPRTHRQVRFGFCALEVTLTAHVEPNHRYPQTWTGRPKSPLLLDPRQRPPSSVRRGPRLGEPERNPQVSQDHTDDPASGKHGCHLIPEAASEIPTMGGINGLLVSLGADCTNGLSVGAKESTHKGATYTGTVEARQRVYGSNASIRNWRAAVGIDPAHV